MMARPARQGQHCLCISRKVGGYELSPRIRGDKNSAGFGYSASTRLPLPPSQQARRGLAAAAQLRFERGFLFVAFGA